MTAFSDSYVLTDTILEAYLVGDPRASAIALAALVAANQAWYCARATRIIDAIPYQGYPYLSTQARQFPRKYLPSEYYSPWGELVTVDIYGYCYVSADVPQDVIDATAEEAIALYQYYADTENSDRENLQAQGVEAYNIGGIYSENFKSPNSAKFFGLHSKEAYNLLEKYIARCSMII